MGLLRNRLELDALPPEDQGGSDAELVAQAKQGNARAFGLLYRRYANDIYDFAAYRLSSREDAEDATQTIFLRAAQSLQSCRTDAAFVGWLYAIARHVITDKQRSNRRATVSLIDTMEFEDTGSLPEDLAVRSSERREIRDARARCLSERDRELFDLLVQDLTYAEIAVVLNRRVAAVRVRYSRLLDRLRICLGRGVSRVRGQA
jgi:RNA polymerase sigma factor (sigma-70 family)